MADLIFCGVIYLLAVGFIWSIAFWAAEMERLENRQFDFDEVLARHFAERREE